MSAELRAGYKLTEVGVIPEDWDVTSLGSCLVDSPSYGINAAAVPYSDRLPVYVRITDISEDGRLLQGQRASVRSEMSGNYYLCDGDIVFARTGASVGKSYRYNLNDGPLVYAGFLIRVHPDERKLLSTFAAAFVGTGNYWRWVRLMSMRSGQPGINGSEFAQLPMPLPPLPEQRAIAEALSDADALIESLNQLITKKRNLKQAAMQQLLTGQTRLPGFSGEWEILQVGEIADVKTGPFGSSLHESDYVQDGTPIITVEHLGEFGVTRQNLPLVSAEDCKRLRSYALEVGDIVFSRVGSVDRNALIRKDEEGWLFSGRLLRVRPFKTRAFAPYLSFQFHTDEFKNSVIAVAVGQTMASLNTKILRDLSVAMPSLEEQTAIATILSDMDAELAELESRLAKARHIKQGMMQELLTGRIRLV